MENYFNYFKKIFLISLVIMLLGCDGLYGGDVNGGPQVPPPFVPASCPSYPANVSVGTNPPFNCGLPGPTTLEVVSDLNAFWRSNAQACTCQSDAPNCAMNGFVSRAGPAYIYYDPLFLDQLDRQSGSRLPADYFMAHEYGHAIQFSNNLSTAGVFLELQADCLAGFYTGNRVCRQTVSQADVIATFMFACQSGDPFQSPWWQTGAHGTCEQRASALRQGLNGYLGGLQPLAACPNS